MKNFIKMLTLIIITVVIVGLAVGCAGPAGVAGPQGTAGPQGAVGPQGPIGTNFVKAMAVVDSSGVLRTAYNVDSVTWDTTNLRWEIQLTGISYLLWDYVTVVSPFSGFATQDSLSGKLLITIYDKDGNKFKGGFSFVVSKPVVIA